MKIRALLELVLILAVCLGAVRWNFSVRPLSVPLSEYKWTWVLKEAGDAVLPSLAVAGGLGVWVERVSGRGPAPWDVGRRAWSVFGVFTVAYGLSVALQLFGFAYRRARLSEFLGTLPANTRDRLSSSYLESALCVAIALWITRVAENPKASRPRADAREWAGRAYTGLVAITGLGANLFGAGF